MNTMKSAGGLYLLPHQDRELAFLETSPRALLVSETGTGKTATMLVYAQMQIMLGRRVLWVTSNSLVDQVRWEAGRWFPRAAQPVVPRRDGADGSFLLTTHQKATKYLYGNDVLIVDECQVVGGGGERQMTRAYTGLKALAASADRVVFATAEPLGTVHALDLRAIADCAGLPGIPSRLWMESQVQWRQVTEPRRRRRRFATGVNAGGFRHLVKAMAPSMIRTTLDEVADLPPVVQHQHPVPLSGPATAAYARAESYRGLDGFRLRHDASRDTASLVPVAFDLLHGQYAEHRSVVVFSDQFDMLDSLQQRLEHGGEPIARIDGKQTPSQRTRALAAHRAGDVRYLFITSAGEAGLNAQHASLLMSLIPSYSPARERQREGRIRRVGSPHSSLVHAVVRPDVPHEDHRARRLADKTWLQEQLWDLLAWAHA